MSRQTLLITRKQIPRRRECHRPRPNRHVEKGLLATEVIRVRPGTGVQILSPGITGFYSFVFGDVEGVIVIFVAVVVGFGIFGIFGLLVLVLLLGV